MAENRSPECQGVALGVEDLLSEFPSSEQSSFSEVSHQNCCMTSKQQPEALSEGNGSKWPRNDSSDHRTDQLFADLRISTPSLHEEHAEEVIGSLVQSPCTLVDSSAGAPPLVCKRPMQLQQCNMVTTVCRGALSSDGSGPQLFQGSLGHQTTDKEEFPCDSPQCFSSHFHNTNLEDTFAAYCHPQPIPAPSQLLPPLTGPEILPHLSLPHLMSSFGESGLDAKSVSCCCQLGCSWVGVLPQPQRACTVKTLTRDVGTITVTKSQRDIGVQTEKSSYHVFPHVCLTEETNKYSPKTGQGTPQKAGSKSPVKEVKWDAEGMTWEVYGASVDPEELGLAIQKHLELQIKETASRAAKLSRQNTNTSKHSVSCQQKRRVLVSLRPPSCCIRSAVD